MTADLTGVLDERVRAFLEKPRTAYLSTIDLKGYPHTVPVWFAVDGTDLITSATKSRTRVKYIQANPKGAVTIGGGLGDDEGYLIQGEFITEEDPDNVLRNIIIRRYLAGEAAERLLAHTDQEQRFIFRLTPRKVIKVR